MWFRRPDAVASFSRFYGIAQTPEILRREPAITRNKRQGFSSVGCSLRRRADPAPCMRVTMLSFAYHRAGRIACIVRIALRVKNQESAS